jgi:hypothetical protein
MNSKAARETLQHMLPKLKIYLIVISKEGKIHEMKHAHTEKQVLEQAVNIGNNNDQDPRQLEYVFSVDAEMNMTKYKVVFEGKLKLQAVGGTVTKEVIMSIDRDITVSIDQVNKALERTNHGY